ITFFRQTDQSSASVGSYQAGAFKCLAALAGHGDIPEPKATKPTAQAGKKTSRREVAKKPAQQGKTPPSTVSTPDAPKARSQSPDVGLTVRIEINLPAEGDQATYDRIFKSIRTHFIDG
ncbi:MAG: hypothetical protein ABFC80_07205, partial [Coriobacteriales bacterium]